MLASAPRLLAIRSSGRPASPGGDRLTRTRVRSTRSACTSLSAHGAQARCASPGASGCQPSGSGATVVQPARSSSRDARIVRRRSMQPC
jgi:hypothetical protein